MIEQVHVEGFDKNMSYVIHDGEKAAIVDPCGSIEKVFAVVEEKNLSVCCVLITHSHGDHVDRLDDCLSRYPSPVYMHTNATGRVRVAGKVVPLNDGDEVEVGTAKVRTIHTPGHISDAVCYYVEAEGVLVTGDTLFVEGCGRVSGEASAREMWDSLQKIAALPGETQIFPGHDYGSQSSSTLAWEKENNRFYVAGDFEGFKKVRLG